MPTLGGEPRPYLEGVAEFDWSHDGSRLAYHTPGPGDPLFVSDGSVRSQRPAHLHCACRAPQSLSFVVARRGISSTSSRAPYRTNWTSGAFAPAGGTPERITSHNGRVTYPVLLDRRTLMYLASDPDGSGPWLYSMDVERRIPHRLTSGLDRYTSLAASADGRRLVVTRASPKRTLWRLRIADSPAAGVGGRSDPADHQHRVLPTTGSGLSSVCFCDRHRTRASGSSPTEPARSCGAARERESLAARQSPPMDGTSHSRSGNMGKRFLYVMQADGTNARIVADSLDLQGAPAWAPDGRSITSAADDHGVPHLFRVPIDGRSPASFVREYSVDPAWAPDGRFVVYSGPDIGTTFSVKAVTAEAAPHPLPRPDPDSRRSAPGLPAWRTGTRVPARRDSA